MFESNRKSSEEKTPVCLLWEGESGNTGKTVDLIRTGRHPEKIKLRKMNQSQLNRDTSNKNRKKREDRGVSHRMKKRRNLTKKWNY